MIRGIKRKIEPPPLSWIEKKEFAKACQKANEIDLACICVIFKNACRDCTLTEDDKAFCVGEIKKAEKRLTEHFEKYGCYPE